MKTKNTDNLDTEVPPSGFAQASPGSCDVSRPAVPPVVGKRNHFHSAESLVDDGMASLQCQFQHKDMRAFLLQYTQSVIQRVSADFSVGAQRGIEQAARLLQDPEYYLTLRERRKREAQRQDDYRKQQDREREEQRLAPTAEEIEREICHLEEWRIPQTESDLLRMKERIAYLRALNPKHVRIDDIKKKSWVVKFGVE